MSYYTLRKRRELWSKQANEKQARDREANGPRESYVEIDPYIRIEVYRRHTDETAVFECHEGTQINNYRVDCNGENLGVMGVSNLMRIIGKSLPSFRRMDD